MLSGIKFQIEVPAKQAGRGDRQNCDRQRQKHQYKNGSSLKP